MSQGQLARTCGIDKAWICRIEQGRDASLAKFRVIGRALGVDYRTLLLPDAEEESES
jgi:transcriptional regulator with XRE-family HTH domain